GEALAPLTTVAESFDAGVLVPVDGRLDIEPITAVQDAAALSAQRLDAAARSVEEIDRAALLATVRTAVDEVAELLGRARDATATLTRATTLLPAMLGADGPRNYLVVMQNNAELRSLGG